MAMPVLLLGSIWRSYASVERIDLSTVLSDGAARRGRNTLIVGTDSRAGITASDRNSGAFIAVEVSGSRTDTIMVLHVEGSSTSLVSIPRDLWVDDPESRQKVRINSTYAAGPDNLVRAVTALGIPVDHYMEIDFTGFAAMVDAVGGVEVEFSAPTRDTHSGLDVPMAGPHRLDGTAAVAYVRSRYFEQLRDGGWRIDGTADLGRTERQRAVLSTLLRSATSTRSPITVARLASAIGGGVVLDASTGVVDLVEIARSVDGADLRTEILPVTPRVTSAGAAVLQLQPTADAVVGRLSS